MSKESNTCFEKARPRGPAEADSDVRDAAREPSTPFQGTQGFNKSGQQALLELGLRLITVATSYVDALRCVSAAIGRAPDRLVPLARRVPRRPARTPRDGRQRLGRLCTGGDKCGRNQSVRPSCHNSYLHEPCRSDPPTVDASVATVPQSAGRPRLRCSVGEPPH